MPRKTKTRRTRGDTRTVSNPGKTAPKRPNPPRAPSETLRTQIRGGRPPRFPGRTGGR